MKVSSIWEHGNPIMFSPQSEVCGMVKEGDPARVPYRLSQGFFTLLMFVKFVISVPEH